MVCQHSRVEHTFTHCAYRNWGNSHAPEWRGESEEVVVVEVEGSDWK